MLKIDSIPRIYFGHHKCASSYIQWVVELAAKKFDYSFVQYMQNEYYIPSHQVITIRNSNEEYMHLVEETDFIGFHVIRDPRDIAVSGYFSHLYTHPIDQWADLVDHRALLASLPFTDGLIAELEYLYNVFNSIATWNYNRPNVLEIWYKELSDNEFNFFRKVFDYLNVPLNDDDLREMLDNYNYKSLSGGREKGDEDIHKHYRKGIEGDWKNYFEECHKDYFKATWGETLIQLGFEKDDNW